MRVTEVLDLHRRLIETSRGSPGLRDRGALVSAVRQPQIEFGGEELYSSLEEKAAALGYALIQNHPFVDGNKRAGHASMEVFLRLNGWEIVGPVDEQERLAINVADGTVSRDELAKWLSNHIERLD
nr:type II toxin-antitoxin system death-on-curing family toxin [Salinibacter ruber]